MDYADVMKDLGVHGNATVDQKLTVKGDSDLQGNANVGKNLTVNGTSDLKGDVTMESNATVEKDLTVEGRQKQKNSSSTMVQPLLAARRRIHSTSPAPLPSMARQPLRILSPWKKISVSAATLRLPVA